MPIDSAAKRRSAASFLTFLSLPEPDGVIGMGDRQQVTWTYRGIATSSLVTVIGNARALGAARTKPQATMVADE